MAEGMSFKDALKQTVMDVPLFASGVGIAGNAGAEAAQGLSAGASESEVNSALRGAMTKGALTAGAFDGGLTAAVPMGLDAYENYSPVEIGGLRPEHMQLDPNNAQQNNQIWENYGNVDPNLYSAPDATTSGQPADQSQSSDQSQASTAKPLTQAQINELMNKPITDQ